MSNPMNYAKAKSVLDSYVERVRLGEVSEPLNYEHEQDVSAALNFLKRTDMGRVIRNFRSRVKKADREYKNPKSWIKENIEMLTDELIEPHINKGELDKDLLARDILRDMRCHHKQQDMLYRRAEQKIKNSLALKC